MTRFADQLFTDLMQEHGSALAVADRPAPTADRPVSRLALRSGALVAAAAAVTVGVVALGGDPAYAVTENGDGTVTLTINQASGIAAANSALAKRGLQVVAVPVRAGCPDLGSLGAPAAAGANTTGGARTTASSRGGDGSITVDVQGIPAGRTALVAADGSHGGITLAMTVVEGPVPACVSLPAAPAGGGTTSSGADDGASLSSP